MTRPKPRWSVFWPLGRRRRLEVVGGELVVAMELADRSLADAFRECRSLADAFRECRNAGLLGIPRP